jgi:xanthine dehydrogenase YagR molybdenum-binding subunit
MNAIGKPISRFDGRLKVTGSADYTADIAITGALQGALVSSTIANGHISSLDTSCGENAPGVVAVFTYHNMPRMNPTPKPWSHLHPHGQSYLPLQDDQILYADQPIALVVAATRDQATYAGTLIRVDYEVKPPVVFGPQSAKDAVDPPQFLWPVASSVGDADTAIATAEVRIDQTYTTTDRHHNPMEPHATTAIWDADGALTLYETTQHIFGARELVSIVLGVPISKINVVSHFVGGGFPTGRSRRKGAEPTCAHSAISRPDVFDDGLPASEHSDNCPGLSKGWKVDWHPPRQHYADIDVRQLH